MYFAYFFRLDNFVFGYNKFVNFKLKIQNQLSIIANIF